jgi:hypothetical protein
MSKYGREHNVHCKEQICFLNNIHCDQQKQEKRGQGRPVKCTPASLALPSRLKTLITVNVTHCSEHANHQKTTVPEGLGMLLITVNVSESARFTDYSERY